MKFRAGLAAALLFAVLAGAGNTAAPARTGNIENGSVWHDTAGNEIWCNGGQMLFEGGKYYWIGYDTGPKHPWRIKLYSSTDLVDWTFLNDVMREEDFTPRFTWAGRPGLLHNRRTGKYVVIFEAQTRDLFRHRVGYAVCDRIDGRYTLAHAEYPEKDRSTGDQSLYQEGDDAYLVTVLDSPGLKRPINACLAIFKLTPDYLHAGKKLFEGFNCIDTGIRGNEALHIVRVDGTYYLFASDLLWWCSSETQYATAKSLAGPWSKMRPLRTEPHSFASYNTQHDFIITINGTKRTSYVYAGDRYSQWTGVGTGRNIFLPLEFAGGEPVLRWRSSWRPDTVAGEVR